MRTNNNFNPHIALTLGFEYHICGRRVFSPLGSSGLTLPRSRFLDVTQRSPKRAARETIRPLVWSKNNGAQGADPRVPPLDPPLYIVFSLPSWATANCRLKALGLYIFVRGFRRAFKRRGLYLWGLKARIENALRNKPYHCWSKYWLLITSFKTSQLFQ